MNLLSRVDGSRENPQSNVKQKNNYCNNPNQNSNISKKVMVIGDFMIKYLRSDELSSSDRSISSMGIKSVLIRIYSGILVLRISPYSVQMRENTDQNNSKYGHFSCSVM